MKLVLLLLASASARLAPAQHKTTKLQKKALSKSGGGFDYGDFAKSNPAANGIIIGGVKTAAADAMAQFATPGDFDFKRNVRRGRVL